MEVEQISEGLLKIERDGKECLAIETLIPANSFALTKLMRTNRRQGVVVEGDRLSEWRFEGFVEHEGSILVYGPYRPGVTLAEVLSMPVEDALPRLSRLASAYATLAESSVEPERPHGRGVVLLQDGGVLFVPSEILDSIRQHEGLTAQIEGYERFNFPDLPFDANLSFCFAVFAYRVLTGVYPYDGQDAETIHNRMRAAAFTPAVKGRADLRKDIVQAVEATLAEPSQNVATSTDWADRFSQWASGYTEELTEPQRRHLEERADQEHRRREKTFGRKEFRRKYGRRVVVIALIAIIVGSIPGTIIYNALQPRVTAGFDAPEVIRTFYGSVAELDHMTMEDCVIDDAGRPLIREVTNLFVMTRMQMSVEMQTGFVDAQSWRESGMPDLKNGASPYGIANLQIDYIRGGEEEQIYDVQYEKWSPDYDSEVVDENSLMLGIVGYAIEERLYMTRDRGDWVISRIERSEEERLGIRELRQEAEG